MSRLPGRFSSASVQRGFCSNTTMSGQARSHRCGTSRMTRQWSSDWSAPSGRKWRRRKTSFVASRKRAALCRWNAWRSALSADLPLRSLETTCPSRTKDASSRGCARRHDGYGDSFARRLRHEFILTTKARGGRPASPGCACFVLSGPVIAGNAGRPTRRRLRGFLLSSWSLRGRLQAPVVPGLLFFSCCLQEKNRGTEGVGPRAPSLIAASRLAMLAAVQGDNGVQ